MNIEKQVKIDKFVAIINELNFKDPNSLDALRKELKGQRYVISKNKLILIDSDSGDLREYPLVGTNYTSRSAENTGSRTSFLVSNVAKPTVYTASSNRNEFPGLGLGNQSDLVGASASVEQKGSYEKGTTEVAGLTSFKESEVLIGGKSLDQIGRVNLTPNHLTQFIRENSQGENFRSMMSTILKGMDVKYIPGVMMVTFEDGIYVYPELDSLNTQNNFLNQCFDISDDSDRSSFVVRDFTKPAKIIGDYPNLTLDGRLVDAQIEKGVVSLKKESLAMTEDFRSEIEALLQVDNLVAVINELNFKDPNSLDTLRKELKGKSYVISKNKLVLIDSASGELREYPLLGTNYASGSAENTGSKSAFLVSNVAKPTVYTASTNRNEFPGLGLGNQSDLVGASASVEQKGSYEKGTTEVAGLTSFKESEVLIGGKSLDQIGRVNLTPNHLTQFIRENSQGENFRSMMSTILKGMDVKYIPGVMMVTFEDGIYVYPELDSLNTQNNFLNQCFDISDDSDRSSFVVRDFTKPAKIIGDYPNLTLDGRLVDAQIEKGVVKTQRK